MKGTSKRILILICVLSLGVVWLAGCGNSAADPWLDKWQKVVVDRSAAIDRVEVWFDQSAYSSSFGTLPRSTDDADEISRLLDALAVPVDSFYMTAKEPEETGLSEHSSILLMNDDYHFHFYLQGEDDPFIISVALTESGVVIVAIDDDSAWQYDGVADLDALRSIANGILTAQE